jgi:hypothetical protein
MKTLARLRLCSPLGPLLMRTATGIVHLDALVLHGRTVWSAAEVCQ